MSSSIGIFTDEVGMSGMNEINVPSPGSRSPLRHWKLGVGRTVGRQHRPIAAHPD